MNIKKHLVGFAVFAALLLGIVAFVSLRHTESCDKIVNNWWEVKKIVIDGKDVTKDYKSLICCFLGYNPTKVKFVL